MSVTSLTVQPLRPYAQFTDKNGNLTGEGYSYLYNIYLRLGGSLDSLNAVTLADHTWDSPNPIGSATPSTGKFTTLESTGTTTVGSTLAVGTGVSANSGGIKHKRVTTGSIGAGATALVTCTWTTTFANANYTVTADVIDSTSALASLAVVHIESVTASAVTVRVSNTSAGALTGTLHVIAIHD